MARIRTSRHFQENNFLIARTGALPMKSAWLNALDRRIRREVAREAVERLTARLDLSAVWSEDWPVEAADPARIEEFCAFYSSGDLTGAEKIALMHLIIASLDEYLLQTPPGEQDARIGEAVERLLRADFPLHAEAVQSWARLDVPEGVSPGISLPPDIGNDFDLSTLGDDEDEAGWVFYVTPLMRRIWADHAPQPAKKPAR
jgi:hypothetical protein